ncbi:putative dispersed gene family protein 1 (DGF-1), partial [Trypanosoma cruzi]
TLRHCVLEGGAQLRIGGLSESTAPPMPRALVNMTNVTSVEGTIVLHGAMPPHSSVLLANSTLRATVGGSQYVPTTRGHEGFWYGPALVLDGVRLLSTRFVMTRSTLVCGGVRALRSSWSAASAQTCPASSTWTTALLCRRRT